jgi:hypothetical protein
MKPGFVLLDSNSRIRREGGRLRARQRAWVRFIGFEHAQAADSIASLAEMALFRRLAVHAAHDSRTMILGVTIHHFVFYLILQELGKIP